MQTEPILHPRITLKKSIQILNQDVQKFGKEGFFRGQRIGIIKGIFSLTIFHEMRMMILNF